ncbi:MAG: quinol oxidase [Flavobacteriales bacterium]|nr:quinol oxidase [Flavobacteriales bacterium]
MNHQIYSHAGMFTTALRWVAGWTYFSAFWRRVVLENKLNPEEAGYIGEKFNHFLPHALGIKPIIENLVSNPDSLWYAMVAFTIIEGLVGLFFMLGLFTRVMSVAVLGLAFGILLGSGWLGTTCLDEWQIGVLGVAAGFTIFFTGGGKYALDNYLIKRKFTFAHSKWFGILSSGMLPLKQSAVNKIALFGSIFILGLTLFTNQYFHGGVYGKLHNLSVSPHVIISDAQLENDELTFTVFRDEGVDVYGSFLIGVKLIDPSGKVVLELDQAELSQFPTNRIENDYVAEVKPGKHSLILPLGARATLTIPNIDSMGSSGNYKLELLDISGATWRSDVLMP